MSSLRTSVGRLLLRRWEATDVEAFFGIYSRWEVMRWLGAEPRRPLADLDEARERLARWHERESGRTRPQGFWALVLLTEPDRGPVGTVMLLPLQEGDTASDLIEIGWHLHPDCQHRGLVTEAAGAVLQCAAEAGLDSVLAVTDPDNGASQAVCRRLGMIDEGLTDRWFDKSLRHFSSNSRMEWLVGSGGVEVEGADELVAGEDGDSQAVLKDGDGHHLVAGQGRPVAGCGRRRVGR